MTYRLDKMMKILREDNVVPPAHIKESLLKAVRADAFSVKRGFALRYAVGFAIVIVLGTGGTVFASQQVMPGNILYPIKRATETAYVNIQPNEQSRAGIQEALIERRYSEAKMIEADSDYYEMLANDIAEESDAWIASQERHFSNDIRLVSDN